MMQWPDKDARELFETAGFVEAYARLPGSTRLTIVSKSDKPDYVVTDTTSNQEYGVELTAVYLDDRSVPDHHKPISPGTKDIPYSRAVLEQYLQRLLSAVEDKIRKARAGYDLSRPLILAVYVNEYVAIYLDQEDLDLLVSASPQVFDHMAPFSEIIFWALANGGIFRVRPS